ncbi:unnamed protein product [Lasius platythorax]|uniref:Uncharacterized protein n=1 Tax=Lasius platythorax TaxID=488582 RepID=A0AAV2NDE3_9HYME
MRWFRILGTNYWNVIREETTPKDDSLSELVSGSARSLEPMVDDEESQGLEGRGAVEREGVALCLGGSDSGDRG